MPEPPFANLGRSGRSDVSAHEPKECLDCAALRQENERLRGQLSEICIAWENYQDAMSDHGYKMLPPWPALELAIADATQDTPNA